MDCPLIYSDPLDAPKRKDPSGEKTRVGYIPSCSRMCGLIFSNMDLTLSLNEQKCQIAVSQIISRNPALDFDLFIIAYNCALTARL
jgi:hypothetical protein